MTAAVISPNLVEQEPTMDQFNDAVRSGIEQPLQSWLPKASSAWLGLAFVDACDLGNEPSVKVLHPEVASRSKEETVRGQLARYALIDGVKKAAVKNHRELVMWLIDNGAEARYAATGACIGGHVNLFEAILQHTPVNSRHSGNWLLGALSGKHQHMYDRLTRLVIQRSGAEGLTGLIDYAPIEIQAEFTRWMTRPLAEDEVKKILNL